MGVVGQDEVLLFSEIDDDLHGGVWAEAFGEDLVQSLCRGAQVVVAIAGVAQEPLVRDQQGVAGGFGDFVSDQILKAGLPFFIQEAVEPQDRFFDPCQGL